MSIKSEIDRIKGLKSRLVTKLVKADLVTEDASLGDCVDALELFNFQYVLEDDSTGTKYKIGINNGILYIKETDEDADSILIIDSGDNTVYKLGINEEKIYIQQTDS